MIGDVIVIKDHHRTAASQIFKILQDSTDVYHQKVTVSMGGESGSGKSEISEALSEVMTKNGLKCTILQQDDYFFYPPKTNSIMRSKIISRVGPQEVRLDLLDDHLLDFKSSKEKVTKPLVNYRADKIEEETIDFRDMSIIIVDGTYTTMLKHVDVKVFINRTYRETRQDRLERAREEQNEYLEEILKIEHGIISEHLQLSDIIVDNQFKVTANTTLNRKRNVP